MREKSRFVPENPTWGAQIVRAAGPGDVRARRIAARREEDRAILSGAAGGDIPTVRSHMQAMKDAGPLPRGPRRDRVMVEWITSEAPVPYETAVAEMEARAAAIRAGAAPEAIWLLEHPPLYTAGTSADPRDLRVPDRFPVYETRRGGQYTYHGPGQRVVYAMLDLETRGRDVRAFVGRLEAWVIAALAEFNLRGEIRPGRVGVWIARPDKPPLPDGTPREDKIAAIGVRIRRWVSFHGISINVEPDLSHFDGIVPCGIEGHGVTSLVDLGLPVTMPDLDVALKRSFAEVFGG